MSLLLAAGSGGGGALSGSVAGTSAVTGTLTGLGALTGTAAGTSTVTGVLVGLAQITGSAAGTSTVTGTLSGLGALTGSAAGTSTVTGTLTAAGGGGALTGQVDATATVTGTLTDTGPAWPHWFLLNQGKRFPKVDEEEVEDLSERLQEAAAEASQEGLDDSALLDALHRLEWLSMRTVREVEVRRAEEAARRVLRNAEIRLARAREAAEDDEDLLLMAF